MKETYKNYEITFFGVYLLEEAHEAAFSDDEFAVMY